MCGRSRRLRRSTPTGPARRPSAVRCEQARRGLARPTPKGRQKLLRTRWLTRWRSGVTWSILTACSRPAPGGECSRRHGDLVAAGRFQRDQRRGLGLQAADEHGQAPLRSARRFRRSPLGSMWMSRRFLATSTPAKMCAMPRPCECGLSRAKRLFRFVARMADRAPGSKGDGSSGILLAHLDIPSFR